MVGSLGVREVQGSLWAQGEAVPRAVSRPPVQMWCFRKVLEGLSHACLRSRSREPGFLFFQCLPDVLLSLAGGEAIMFTSKVTSFLEPPDAACFTSCLTDTALHIISLTIWPMRDIDQQLVVFLIRLWFNFLAAKGSHRPLHLLSTHQMFYFFPTMMQYFQVHFVGQGTVCSYPGTRREGKFWDSTCGSTSPP